jgi:PAS domain-containing protein
MSEAEIEALLRALQDCAVFEVDEHGDVTRWFVGGASQAQAGSAFASLFTARDRDRGWPRRMLAWARQASVCKDEGWRLREGEQRFWSEHVIAAISDQAGEPRGYMNVLFDASRRLASERAVSEADRRILEYQRIARLGSFEYDPYEGRYLVTPEVLYLLGVAEGSSGTADFIPFTADALLKRLTAEEAARFQEAAASEGGTLLPVTAQQAGDHAGVLHIRTEAVRDREGQVLRYVGTIQDVTEIVKAAPAE